VNTRRYGSDLWVAAADDAFTRLSSLFRACVKIVFRLSLSETSSENFVEICYFWRKFEKVSDKDFDKG
jgi:hypothetical protein